MIPESSPDGPPSAHAAPAPLRSAPAPGRRPRSRARLGALVAALLTLPLAPARAADWPTYAADDARSGISPDPLPGTLVEAWTWNSVHPPQPAWQGEAKWDGWNKVYNLKPRQIFDRAFHAVIAGDRVLFGSSADDQVRCLDLKNGRELWTFYTDGPVRLAPTVSGDRVYFGSDDGRVYCLEATSGTVVWQTRVGPEDRRIPGNGRVISVWPVRTSVVVRDGVLYTTAGMFPAEGIHLVALDAATGRERWRQVQKDLPAQGYLLASSTRLYVPAGRDNPVICNLEDGSRIRVVEGAGGTYALLSGDGLVFGPGKTGQLGLVEDNHSDQLASFQGNHMIVTPDRSYLHSDTEVSALDRARYLALARDRKKLAAEQASLGKALRKLPEKPENAAARAPIQERLAKLGSEIDAISDSMQRCLLWKVPCTASLSFILAGTTLVAGGEGAVLGLDPEQGTTRWTLPVAGRAYGLATSAGTLVVSTDRGSLHCFRAPAARAALDLPRP